MYQGSGCQHFGYCGDRRGEGVENFSRLLPPCYPWYSAPRFGHLKPRWLPLTVALDLEDLSGKKGTMKSLCPKSLNHFSSVYFTRIPGLSSQYKLTKENTYKNENYSLLLQVNFTFVRLWYQEFLQISVNMHADTSVVADIGEGPQPYFPPYCLQSQEKLFSCPSPRLSGPIGPTAGP